MKKFSKIIACLSAFAMCISTLDFSGSISAYSAYTGHDFTEAEIEQSPVKPNIKIGYEYFLGTAWEPGHGTASIDITLSGENVDNNYCNTGLRISYPKIKEYYTSGLPYYVALEIVDVKPGKAIESLSYNVEYNDDNSIFLTTEGESNAGQTGVMYTLICKTPDYIRGGEKFEIKVDTEKSYFQNYENDETGKLMQDYLFTKGIKNGYVECGYMTTTSAYYDTTTSTTKKSTTTTTTTDTPTTTYYTTTTTTRNTYTDTSAYTTTTSTTTDTKTTTYYYDDDTAPTRTSYITTTYPPTTTDTLTTTTSKQTTTTAKTTAPVVTGTGYENWTTFEDTIVSIEDNKVTFAERGKTSVMNNGYNMEMIKDAGVGSKVSVEAIISPSGSILNIIGLEVLEKPAVQTGDANGDGETSLADAVLLMQLLANPSEFSISDDCAKAADVVNKGDGITPMDALAIQMLNINLIKPEDLPTTSEKLQALVQ